MKSFVVMLIGCCAIVARAESFVTVGNVNELTNWTAGTTRVAQFGVTGGGGPASGDMTNLYIWYKFASDASDSSGHSINGSLSNGASVVAGELVLDGTDDFVDLGDITGMDDMAKPFSIGFWMTCGNVSKNYSMLFDKFAVPGYSLNLRATDAVPHFQFYSSGWADFADAYTLSNNQTNLLVITWDGTNTTTFYVDGRLDYTATATPPAFDVANDNRLEIGARAGTSDYNYQGKFQEIFLYTNRILDLQQVTNRFSTGPN